MIGSKARITLNKLLNFATGRNPKHASVAATTGIMRIPTERELRGVMAHVKHRDILISIAITGAISSLAQFGYMLGGSRNNDCEGGSNPVLALLMMILVPIAAMLIQFAIFRAPEFDADHGEAELSVDQQALTSALVKIQRYAQGIPLKVAEAHLKTAQMMIVTPLSSKGLKGLFRTHRNTIERIQRLLAMTRA